MNRGVALSTGYKRYVLVTLTLVYTLNCLDVPLINLLLQPIKVDLHLSDAQLGLVTGIAFALFYATLGIPISRLADRGNRVTITAVAIAAWALTVMASLFVMNFVQLLIARVAAGLGEAGCMPPTYSLLGDYFPEPAERTRAMVIYMLSSPLAPLVSFILGGWLNEHYGWRVAFFAIGVPGLVFAVLVKLTVVEPRARVGQSAVDQCSLPRTRDVLAALWRQRASRHLTIATVAFFTIGLGLGPWLAAFMIRSHGMGTAELGLSLGLIWGVGGMAGVLAGGYVIERWFGGNERRQMQVLAVVVALLVPCYALVLFLPGRAAALAAMVPLVLAGNFLFGPIFALLQRLVLDRMRATTLAVVMLLANLIGMGLGPQAVGVLSDWLAPALGGDSLRYAMLIVSLVALFAAYHFWKAGETVRGDLAEVAAHAAREDGLCLA